MKAAGVKAIKDDLKLRSKEELEELCLKLSKFKKRISLNLEFQSASGTIALDKSIAFSLGNIPVLSKIKIPKNKKIKIVNL